MFPLRRPAIGVSVRLRILQIGPLPPPTDGGIAAYLEGLLRSPLTERFDVTTFDVRVSPVFRKYRWLRPFLTLVFLWRLQIRLLRDRPQLAHIHCSGHASFWEKALLARLVMLRHVPFLLHLHGGDFDRFLLGLRPPWKAWARRVMHSASAVIVPARGWRPLVEGFAGAGRVAVVPNAIHCEDFASEERARPNGPVRILFLGMVSARKGLDDLREAVQQLVRDGCTDFRLDIVGGEEGYGQLEHFTENFHAAGLDTWVRFHGMKLGKERLAFLRDADLFVLPSRNESFGIANLEAMACGLPVVSTRTGAIPEYLESGVHGLLVEPGDVNGLASALRQLIQSSPLRARLGAAARERALEYDWQSIADVLAATYHPDQGTTGAVSNDP
jgi:glycosyltransferase involved in cell wall biosynthesis